MEFQDRRLTCVDCGTEFTWTAGEQLFSEVFPIIVAKGVELFSDYSDADYEALERTLAGLKATISAGSPL